MLPRAALLASLTSVLLGLSPTLALEPGAPAASPAGSVQALLDRAATQPLDQRLQALEEAAHAAESADDPAGGLAVATLAESTGQERYQRGDLTAAERLLR